MTEPVKQPPEPTPETKPGWKDKPKKGAFFSIVLLAAALTAWLSPSEGGQRLDVYLDSAGIKTVCTGIIGLAVNAHEVGYRFTKAQCDAMDSAYVTKQLTQMQACTPPAILQDTAFGEFVSYAHWAYNTGTGAFCHSTLAKKLAAGDHAGACKAMAAWTFITVKGQKVNCRNAGKLCRGIVTRRDEEVSLCLSALN